MIRRNRIRLSLVVLLCMLLFVRAGVSEQTMTVRNLRVTFPAEDTVRVRGEFRCSDIEPKDVIQSGSTVAVNIDFPRGKAGFTLLPERFQGHYTSHRGRKRSVPCFFYEGEWYVIRAFHDRFYNSTRLLYPPIYDRTLRSDRDDGRWIGFDKTLQLHFRVEKTNLPYRIVVGWTLDYIAYDQFEHNYFWVVYGPFRWGEAPLCRKTLTAKLARPVSFTAKGVEVKKASTTQPGNTNTTTGTGGATTKPAQPAKRKPLTRMTSRPNQLQAVNAGNALELTLNRMPGISRAGVRVTPRMGAVFVDIAKGVTPDALSPLIAEVSVETAYALRWIGTMEITARTARGPSTVRIDWNSVAAYVAGKVTPAEFFATWNVQGQPLTPLK